MARAFILNAILVGITTVLTIEVRKIVDENKYTKGFPDRPHKVFITTIFSVLIGILSYTIIRFVFGAGGGMLAPFKNLIQIFYNLNIKYLYK